MPTLMTASVRPIVTARWDENVPGKVLFGGNLLQCLDGPH